MEQGRKLEYDAAGEHNREMRERRVGGNIPMEMIGRIRAREVNAMVEDPAMRATLQPGYGPKIMKIMMLDKEARLEALSEIYAPEEIKAAMAAEHDPDIIRYLAEKYGEAYLATQR